MIDALAHGATVEQAVAAGLRSAALAVPGAVVGASGSRLTRELGGPLAAGGTAYLGAIASGQSREEALRAAAVAVAANVVTSRAQHGAEADARLEARGRAIGEALRPSGRATVPASATAPPITVAGQAAPDSPSASSPPQATSAAAPATATPGPTASSAQTSAGAGAAQPTPTPTVAAAPQASIAGAPASTATASPGPRESAGATPPGIRQHTDPFTGQTHPVTASARAPSAIHGHMRGTGAEFEAYNTALHRRGEIGIQRPGRVNEGGPDFITARVAPNGPPGWMGEVQAAVAPGRLNLGDAALEAQIRAAVTAGNVTMRNLQVRISPTGLTITGW